MSSELQGFALFLSIRALTVPEGIGVLEAIEAVVVLRATQVVAVITVYQYILRCIRVLLVPEVSFQVHV